MAWDSHPERGAALGSGCLRGYPAGSADANFDALACTGACTYRDAHANRHTRTNSYASFKPGSSQ